MVAKERRDESSILAARKPEEIKSELAQMLEEIDSKQQQLVEELERSSAGTNALQKIDNGVSA